MQTVSFVIAGVQKGGTTALADYLRQHPQLWIPAAKELHFFDDETLNWQHPHQLYPSYHAWFDEAAENQVWGEATPIYSYWWPSMQRIWAYNPAIKIILCLRNPVERAFSHWAMETKRGWDTVPFTDAVLSESQRCRQALPQQHRVFSYVGRGFYSEQLRRLWSFFPREQTLILKQEDLLTEPHTTLKAVHRFLGVNHEIPKTQVRSNIGIYGNYMNPETSRLLHQIYHPEIIQLEQLLGWDLRGWRGD